MQLWLVHALSIANLREHQGHGTYIGLLAQEIYKKQTPKKQKEMYTWALSLLQDLYENELEYTEDVYDQVGLAPDVKKFIRYNANKALNNLGFEHWFEEEDVNPIVINGLSTKTKSHDFFSTKGNGYKKATVEPLKDSDFIFDNKGDTQ